MTENVTILFPSWDSVLPHQQRPVLKSASFNTTPSACSQSQALLPTHAIFQLLSAIPLNLVLQPTDYVVRSVARSGTGTCGAGCPSLPFRVHSVVALVCAPVSRRSELLGKVRGEPRFDINLVPPRAANACNLLYGAHALMQTSQP